MLSSIKLRVKTPNLNKNVGHDWVIMTISNVNYSRDIVNIEQYYNWCYIGSELFLDINLFADVTIKLQVSASLHEALSVFMLQI